MSGLFAGTPLERPVTCERCGEVRAQCVCPPEAPGAGAVPVAQQQARVRRERRRGKMVTVISGVESGPQGPLADLRALLKHLKSTLGAGGSLGAGQGGVEIEVQGDHRDKVVEMLRAMGYPAKGAGG